MHQEDIKRWLSAGHLHKDVIVTPKDLRKGDHIFRIIRTAPLNYHHGIYMDDNTVVEFNSGNSVGSRTLENFYEQQPLYKRDYRGKDLSVVETEKLVNLALSQSLTIDPYNILTNNCEHFATSMKLKVAWSGQVEHALAITSQVFNNIQRPISLIVEGVETGTTITVALTAAPKSIFNIFSSASTSVLSSLAKAAIVLGPVTVALDITSLVFEYKKENESAQVCKDTIKELTEIKAKTQDNSEKLNRLKILLTERLRIAELFEEEVSRLEAEGI